MKNWIRVGNHYINLDTIGEILSDVERIDHKKPYPANGREAEPAVVFMRAAPVTYDGMTLDEISFFGEDREKVLRWLANDVELKVTNLNFA